MIPHRQNICDIECISDNNLKKNRESFPVFSFRHQSSMFLHEAVVGIFLSGSASLSDTLLVRSESGALPATASPIPPSPII